MKKLVFLFIVIILIVFGLAKLRGENISAGSLPGDFLYSFDKSWEWINLNLLTFTDDGKVKLELKFMEERISELKRLQEKGELTVDRAKQLMDDYNNLIAKTQSGIKNISDANKNIDDIIIQAQSISNKHRDVVDLIIQSAPETTAEFLSKTLNFGEDLYKKTENIFR